MIIKGNKELLEKKLALILNSSQTKTPCGQDPWIGATKTAIEYYVSQKYPIISSLGLVAWELPIYLVSELNGNHVIISPVFDGENGESVFRNTLCEFGLNAKNTVMVFLDSALKTKSPKSNWLARDKVALALAKVVAPVSLRPAGRLDELLSVSEIDIDSSFKIEYAQAISRPAHYNKLLTRTIPDSWSHVAHWTKTAIGPWPGETKREFYSRIVVSGQKYPHGAFETLVHIIKEKKIRAASEKIREKAAVVGFSEASPGRIIELLRWCPKKVNWNFEPYGIAIDKEFASGLGIRPVVYGQPRDYDGLPVDDKPFFHSRGGENVDWRYEQEWRHLGDLELSKIPNDKITYFVWDKHEAEIVSGMTSSKVHAFCAGL
jgi:hypothetical protein